MFSEIMTYLVQMLLWAARLVGALGLFALNAFAAGPSLDASTVGSKPVPLRPYFSVMEDPGAALTIADAQSAAVAGRFKPSEASTRPLNFGSTASAYWLQLQVSCTTVLKMQFAGSV